MVFKDQPAAFPIVRLGASVVSLSYWYIALRWWRVPSTSLRTLEEASDQDPEFGALPGAPTVGETATGVECEEEPLSQGARDHRQRMSDPWGLFFANRAEHRIGRKEIELDSGAAVMQERPARASECVTPPPWVESAPEWRPAEVQEKCVLEQSYEGYGVASSSAAPQPQPPTVPRTPLLSEENPAHVNKRVGH